MISSTSRTVPVERWNFHYCFLMLSSEIEVFVPGFVPVCEDGDRDVEVERDVRCVSRLPDRREAVDDHGWCLLVIEL
jgi:hypothetical protein